MPNQSIRKDGQAKCSLHNFNLELQFSSNVNSNRGEDDGKGQSIAGREVEGLIDKAKSAVVPKIRCAPGR